MFGLGPLFWILFFTWLFGVNVGFTWRYGIFTRLRGFVTRHVSRRDVPLRQKAH